MPWQKQDETVGLMLREINAAIAEGDFSANEWETSFLETVGRYIQEGWALSRKQDEILERVWKKAKGH